MTGVVVSQAGVVGGDDGVAPFQDGLPGGIVVQRGPVGRRAAGRDANRAVGKGGQPVLLGGGV